MQTLVNATVLPFNRGKFGWVDGGVYRDDGRRLLDWPVLASSRSTQLVAKRRLSTQSIATEVPDAIYGGAWFLHFGHFLTETLPNLAAIASCEPAGDTRPIYFQTLHSDLTDLNSLPSYAGIFLQKIGVNPGRLKLVNSPLTFAQLTLPPSPFQRKYEYNDRIAAVLDDVLKLEKRQGAGRNLYFTRSKVASKGRNAETEQEMEHFFATRGFEIISPETLSIDTQLALVSEAATIAGQNGSALHWSLLSRDLNQVIELGWSLKLQRGICKLRGQLYRPLPGAGLSRVKGRQQRQLPVSYLEKNLRDL